MAYSVLSERKSRWFFETTLLLASEIILQNLFLGAQELCSYSTSSNVTDEDVFRYYGREAKVSDSLIILISSCVDVVPASSTESLWSTVTRWTSADERRVPSYTFKSEHYICSWLWTRFTGTISDLAPNSISKRDMLSTVVCIWVRREALELRLERGWSIMKHEDT